MVNPSYSTLNHTTFTDTPTYIAYWERSNVHLLGRQHGKDGPSLAKEAVADTLQHLPIAVFNPRRDDFHPNLEPSLDGQKVAEQRRDDFDPNLLACTKRTGIGEKNTEKVILLLYIFTKVRGRRLILTC